MVRFEFELRPLAEVPLWGSDRPTLHWFGLTSGWYWISGPDGEFLRYRDGAVREWDLQRPYPGYYVARFWEDLILLRWVLQEPVPEDLVSFVDGTFLSREFPDRDDFGYGVEEAFDVQSDHAMYLGYLTDSPHLTCWRHAVAGEDVVTLSQQIAPTEHRAFAGPDRWDVTVPAGDFFAALEDFDRRFIAAMEVRVAELERSGSPSGVDLDVRQLRVEHVQRSGWLGQRLVERREVDWAKVRAGVAEVRTWPPVSQGDSG